MKIWLEAAETAANANLLANCGAEAGAQVNEHKLKQRFRLDIRADVFPLRTARCCVGLIKDITLALFSEVFKTQVDKALSNQVWSHS